MSTKRKKAENQMDRAVEKAIKKFQKRDHATAAEVTNEVMRILENDAKKSGGGAHAFSPALVFMGLKQIATSKVTKAFKQTMPPDIAAAILKNAPPDIRHVIVKVPAWIALEQGPKARRVPSWKASPEDWDKNASLKERIADRTREASLVPRDIGGYLRTYGVTSLGDWVE